MTVRQIFQPTAAGMHKFYKSMDIIVTEYLDNLERLELSAFLHGRRPWLPQSFCEASKALTHELFFQK